MARKRLERWKLQGKLAAGVLAAQHFGRWVARPPGHRAVEIALNRDTVAQRPAQQRSSPHVRAR